MRKRREAGFSLLEALMVVALIVVGSTVAIIQLRSTVAILDADRAAGLVVSQVSYARGLAVNERRNVTLGFVGNNEIRVTRQELPSGSTVMSDVTLPSGYTFAFPSGIADTPDLFLAGSSLYASIGTTATAVFIGSGTNGTFLGDGTFVDTSNILLNGSVFTKGSNNGSARAITVSGSTGKIKQYWLKASVWVTE